MNVPVGTCTAGWADGASHASRPETSPLQVAGCGDAARQCPLQACPVLPRILIPCWPALLPQDTSPDVVYALLPPGPGPASVTAATCGSSYDTVLLVGVGSMEQQVRVVAGDAAGACVPGDRCGRGSSYHVRQ